MGIIGGGDDRQGSAGETDRIVGVGGQAALGDGVTARRAAGGGRGCQRTRQHGLGRVAIHQANSFLVINHVDVIYSPVFVVGAPTLDGLGGGIFGVGEGVEERRGKAGHETIINPYKNMAISAWYTYLVPQNFTPAMLAQANPEVFQ